MASGKKVKDVEKKEEKKEEPKKEEKKKPEIRRDIPQQIIRVAGTDLDGGKPVLRAIKKIKGIGSVMNKAICIAAKIDPMAKLGSLTESDIANLENVIKNPTSFNIPSFLVNRRKDPATGADAHLTSSDLDISRRFDIQRYIDLKTYRGWRHMLGQPVRGQRTRSTFRVTGMTVGVMKAAVQKPGAAPATGAPAAAAAPAAGAAKTEAKPIAIKPAK